jgi:hypothetical protein
MESLNAAIFFGVTTGVVSAGLVSSLWTLTAGDSPRFRLLFESDFLTPIRIIVVIFAAPMIVLSHSVWWLIVRPPLGFVLFILGLFWSFIQGVFILTQVFNIP